MEEITEAQSTKLSNFKEQLSQIKVNIDISNKELESKLEELHNKNVAIRILENDINELESEKNLLVKRKAELLQPIRDAVKELENNKTDFDKYVKEKERIISEFEDSIELRNSRITYLDSIIKNRENEFNILENKISKLSIDFTNLTDSYECEKNKLQSKISEDTEDYESLKRSIKYLESEKKIKFNELIELKELVDKERSKIEIPSQQLYLANRELDRRERSLKILYSRVKKAFELLYPNQNIDNIIKL